MTETSEKLHFLDYWRVVRSRWEVVVAVTLFVFITGTAITLTLPRTYSASTRILIELEAPDVAIWQQQALWEYNPFFLQTEKEIIRSKPVLHDVIRRLDLRKKWGAFYVDEGESMSLRDAYLMLRDSIGIEQYRDTKLVEIRVQRSTPKEAEPWIEASQLANAVAEAYRDYRLRRMRDELAVGIESLRDERRKQQEKVTTAEQKLQALRVEGGISTINRVQLDKSELHQLEMTRIAAKSDMLVRKARLDEIRKLEGDELLNSIRYVVQDAGLEAFRRQLSETQINLKLLQESYGPNHPEVVRARTGIAEIRKKLDDALVGLKLGLEADYQVAKSKFAAIDEELHSARDADIAREGADYLSFRNAEEDLVLQRQILAALETRLSQEGIELELPRTPVKVVDPAEPDERPVAPNLPLNIILSVVVGLMTGVGLAYLIEYLDTSVKTVEEIERLLAMPVLGVIPQKVRPLLEEGSDAAHAEAYRVLRTNMHFSSRTTGGKTFCVTSGGAGEGKSLTLFNLAYVSALLGDKVLVVDSDFRRPSQHRMFGIPNDKGLVSVLMGDERIEDMIRVTKVPNLHFMPSGRIRSVALSLLDSHRMLDLVKSLKLRYDYVFFDTPPIVGVSDASVLASEVDGVLLIIQHRKYPRVVSTRAKTLIENVGGNLIGVVLNNINIGRDYYSYYYHTSYGQGYEIQNEPEGEVVISSGA